MGVVVPHGVLFRANSEGQIRRKLVEQNLLDAVIGLPQNLFYGTGIPAAILLFRRNKPDDTVAFIDASRDFEPGTNQNKLRLADIKRIADIYQERATVERYSYVATCEEIIANDFNLNILRYVNTFEEEEEINITDLQAQISHMDVQMTQLQIVLNSYLKDLGYGS